MTLDNIPCTPDSTILVDGEIFYSESPLNPHHSTSLRSHGTFHLSKCKIRNRHSKYRPWGDTYPHARHRSMNCRQRYIYCCSLLSKEKSRSVSYLILTNFRAYLERFPIECRKTKTKVITLTNCNRCKQHNEPIRIRSKYM